MWSLDLVWRWRGQVPQETDEHYGFVRGQHEQVPVDLVDKVAAPVIETSHVLFELGGYVGNHGLSFFRTSIPEGVTAHTTAFLRCAVILLPPVS